MEKFTTEQIIAKRRAALFNVKVRNMNIKDILHFDPEEQRKLENEREILSITLKTKLGIQNTDEYLLPIKVKRNVLSNEK